MQGQADSCKRALRSFEYPKTGHGQTLNHHLCNLGMASKHLHVWPEVNVLSRHNRQQHHCTCSTCLSMFLQCHLSTKLRLSRVSCLSSLLVFAAEHPSWPFQYALTLSGAQDFSSPFLFCEDEVVRAGGRRLSGRWSGSSAWQRPSHARARHCAGRGRQGAAELSVDPLSIVLTKDEVPLRP